MCGKRGLVPGAEGDLIVRRMRREQRESGEEGTPAMRDGAPSAIRSCSSQKLYGQEGDIATHSCSPGEEPLV